MPLDGYKTDDNMVDMHKLTGERFAEILNDYLHYVENAKILLRMPNIITNGKKYHYLD